MNYKSPITNSENIEIFSRIKTDYLVKKYSDDLNVDIKNLLGNIDEVLILKCRDTGYKFFSPNNISGDGQFYETLQKFEWYYMSWKWEHEQAIKSIKVNDNLLEVGCGSAGFLKEVSKRLGDVTLTGLELNPKAILNGKSEGLNILEETIQEHAIKNPEKYDVVCSFQVL